MSHAATETMPRVSALSAVAGPDRKANPNRGGTRIIRLVVACSAFLACAVIGGIGVTIAHLRASALADTERELSNLSLVLAEQTARSFEALALVQSGLIERMDKLGVASEAELQNRMSGHDAHLLLKDTINGLPHVESVAVIDPHGSIVNFSRSWPIPSVNVADREYYKTLKADRRVASVLSEPVLNRTTGTWSIYLARAFRAPNGELLGIIAGGMERRYFDKLFSTITLGAGSSISLVRTDGLLLAGYSPNGAIDDALADVGSLTLLARQGVARIYGRDGAERLVAARSVAHYPMMVSVGMTSAAALTDWRSQAFYLGTAAILVALAIGGVTFVGVHWFQDYAVAVRERANRTSEATSRKATELVLRETERVRKLLNNQKVLLDTALENMSQGLVMLDAEARMLICNQRYVEMYGMSPDVVVPGCTLRELIEHRVKIGSFTGNIDETVNMILAAIARGKPSKLSTQTADGRVISVSTRPMADGGWVATHEDVTDQRRAEREADRAQRFLLTVIENVSSAIVVKDARDLTYVLINRAGEKFYGVPRSDVIGRTSHDLFPKVSADLIVAHDESLLQSDGELTFDAHMLETPANGRRLVKARRLAIRDGNGKPQFLLSVIDDVTERGQET